MSASLTETPAPAGPVARSERIETLDVVRGFALLGILLMNIVGMGAPMALYSNPVALGPVSQADHITWFITNTFFEGSMRTLFSMLFGAGFFLLLERLEKRGLMGAKIFLRRSLLLMLMGVLDMGLLLWTGDILFCYGFAALFLMAFWKSSIRGLALWSVILIAVMTLAAGGGGAKFTQMHADYQDARVLQEAGVTLNAEQTEALAQWPRSTKWWSPSREEVRKIRERAEQGWGAVAAHNLGELFSTQLGFFFLFLIFDALAAMLLGMIAYRIGLIQGRWPLSGAALLTLVCFGVGIPVNLWETNVIIDSGYSIHGMFQSFWTYHPGRILLAGGWLGLILMACKAPWLLWFRAGLGAIGRMALSNYLAHSLIAAVLFVGLGWFGKLARVELYYVVVGMWAFNLVFSLLWLRFFRMGPIEWLWRAGTYGTWPPLLRDPSGGPA